MTQLGVSDITQLAYDVHFRVEKLSQFLIIDGDGVVFNRRGMIEHILEVTNQVLEERENNGEKTDK